MFQKYPLYFFSTNSKDIFIEALGGHFLTKISQKRAHCPNNLQLCQNVLRVFVEFQPQPYKWSILALSNPNFN